eukprot:6538524-Prymnesium_polylepis.1
MRRPSATWRRRAAAEGCAAPNAAAVLAALAVSFRSPLARVPPRAAPHGARKPQRVARRVATALGRQGFACRFHRHPGRQHGVRRRARQGMHRRGGGFAVTRRRRMRRARRGWQYGLSLTIESVCTPLERGRVRSRASGHL